MDYFGAPAQLVELAAQIEYLIFAWTFLIVIILVSLAGARFILLSVLDHSFPNWRDWRV
jgi:hypothetical protein